MHGSDASIYAVIELSKYFLSLFFCYLKTETELVSKILYACSELQAIDNVLTSQNMLHDHFCVLYTVLLNIWVSRSPSSVIAHIKLIALHGLLLPICVLRDVMVQDISYKNIM